MPFIATIDFETYSEAGYKYDPALGYFVSIQANKPGIQSINAAVYAAHPSTRVISLSYDIGYGDKLWIPRAARPCDLLEYVRSGGLVEAHNSLFEYYIWNYCCKDWPQLLLDQLRCSASKAQAHGLPRALDAIGKVLKPAAVKDPRGKQLIRLLSIPQKPTKKDPAVRKLPEFYPELFREMYEYNIQDIVSEKSISKMLPELSEFELRVWKLDQHINARGVQIDTTGLQNCIEIFYKAERKYTGELILITGGAVKSVGEITKGSAGDKWLQSQGVDAPSLDKQSVDDLIKYREMPSTARRVLEIRQILGGANVKKLFAIQRCLSSDGRLRDLFLYCGAERTGRWSGSGSQPHNLKNSGPDCMSCPACGYIHAGGDPTCPRCRYACSEPLEWGIECIEAALETMATLDLGRVEDQWGGAIDIIGSCLRGLFVSSPGHDLICADFSAIEAVVIVALAGEEWRLEVFRTHGKIYEASISMATGVPLEEILEHKVKTGQHHPLRKRGKVRELAYGFGGWVGAAKNFGADKFMTDEEIKQDVISWRKESPAIVELWGGQWRKDPGYWHFTPEMYGLEGAAVQALLYPGRVFTYRLISYWHDTTMDVLFCQLPSGRRLTYHTPRLTRGTDPRKLEVYIINFMGWNSDSMKGPVGWVGMTTYGPKLAENVTQATARDILAAAMLRVEAAGYPIVLHVHDEIISEVPEGQGSVEEFVRLMMVRESWFADWPIKAAGGWRGKRYRK